MSDCPLLSVVVSFRNEEDNLPELIRRLQVVLRSMPVRYELIFVNDASTDRSQEVLLKAHEVDPRVKIITLARRFGVTPGVLAGLEHAAGDAVVYLDCDLQDPPELMPTLFEKWQAGGDIVHTSRTRRFGENPLKMWITRMAYRAINSAADITIIENTGDFKLIGRRALNEILKLREFDPFMRGLVAWVGLKQVQVFYERQPRHAGKTKFSLLRSLGPYKEFIRGLTMFSSLPLYFALFLGLLVSLISFVLMAVLLFKLAVNGRVPTWSGLMAVMLFLGGTILFTVGILGIYVGRTYREIKGRPRYVVSDMVGFDRSEFPEGPTPGATRASGFNLRGPLSQP